MTKKILLLGVSGVGKTTTAHFMIQKLKAQNKKVALINLDFYSFLHSLYTLFLTNVLFQKLASWKLPEFYGKYAFKAELNRREYLKFKEAMRRLILLRYILLVIAMFLTYIKLKILNLWYNVLIEHEGHVLKSLGIFYYQLYAYDIKSINLNFLLRMIFKLLDGWTVLYLPMVNYDLLSQRYKKRGAKIEPYDYLYVIDTFYKSMIKYIPTCKVVKIETTEWVKA